MNTQTVKTTNMTTLTNTNISYTIYDNIVNV